MARTIDVTTLRATGRTTKKEYRFEASTYRALVLTDGETEYTVPLTNVENETTPRYDADRVYIHDGRIVVEGRQDGEILETHIPGELGTDGDLLWTGAYATPEDTAMDIDPAERVLWERDETQVPASVVRHRYGSDSVSPMQAIAYHLCDDPDGPELTQQAAGDALGMSRDQLWTHLSRARDKLDG